MDLFKETKDLIIETLDSGQPVHYWDRPKNILLVFSKRIYNNQYLITNSNTCEEKTLTKEEVYDILNQLDIMKFSSKAEGYNVIEVDFKNKRTL